MCVLTTAALLTLWRAPEITTPTSPAPPRAHWHCHLLYSKPATISLPSRQNTAHAQQPNSTPTCFDAQLLLELLSLLLAGAEQA